MSEKKKPIKKEPKYKPTIDTSEIYNTKRDYNPEKDLRADLWDTMPLQELWQQKVVMNNRITYLQQMGRNDIALQVARGMQRLEVLIEEHGKDEAISIFMGRT